MKLYLKQLGILLYDRRKTINNELILNSAVLGGKIIYDINRYRKAEIIKGLFPKNFHIKLTENIKNLFLNLHNIAKNEDVFVINGYNFNGGGEILIEFDSHGQYNPPGGNGYHFTHIIIVEKFKKL